MRVLDLFSGIGGFSLGLERTAGFRTVAFCEIEEYPRRVLAKHWPEVPCYDDVRTLTAERLRADGIAVDVICGGFPCQDISSASVGKAAGIDGARSGLWREYARLVREIGPDWVIVENSPQLRTKGADRVLSDLEMAGYDCWPFVVGAANLGAVHERRRVWIVSYPKSGGRPEGGGTTQRQHASAGGRRTGKSAGVGATAFAGWASEPNVGRVAHGVPSRVDRLHALGNAAVPQIPEAIGRAILAVEAQRQVAA